MSQESADHRARTYFYLSYARVASMRLSPDSPVATVPHPAVKRFYDDLCREVQRLAEPNSRLGIGSIDQAMADHSFGSDSAGTTVNALDCAEVFVPLYGPRYLEHSSSQAEQ